MIIFYHIDVILVNQQAKIGLYPFYGKNYSQNKVLIHDDDINFPTTKQTLYVHTL